MVDGIDHIWHILWEGSIEIGRNLSHASDKICTPKKLVALDFQSQLSTCLLLQRGYEELVLIATYEPLLSVGGFETSPLPYRWVAPILEGHSSSNLIRVIKK